MAQANARQWQRFSYRADVQLRWGDTDAAPPTSAGRAASGGRAINLSQGGLQLRASDAPSVGAAVSCELSCAGQWTTLPGRVRWRSHPPQPDLGTELGIEFGPLSDAQCESVHSLLASLDGAGQTVELKLPELRAPLPARAVLSDRGVRLRASLPFLATGSELDFELADPPLQFAGRVAQCELKRSGHGWELELLVEEREAPRSRRYTMYQLPQLAPARSTGLRRSTLAGATSPLPVLAAAVRASTPPEPANDPRRLEAPAGRALGSGSQLMAAGLESTQLMAAGSPLLAGGGLQVRSWTEARPPAAERRRSWLVEQPYPAPLEARAVRDHDTEEFPPVPKTRAPRLISQLLAVLLGFGVAVTLGRSALRQREADEAYARSVASDKAGHARAADAIAVHPRGVDSLPLGAALDPKAPPTRASDPMPAIEPAPSATAPNVAAPPAAAAPADTLANETTSPTASAADAPARAADPTARVAGAGSSDAPRDQSAPNVAAPSAPANAASTSASNAAPTVPIADVADRPTVQVVDDTTEVFVPVQGSLQGFHEAIWVDPVAFVIDLPEGARVPFQGQRIAYNTGGVTDVGAGKSHGVTQVRVFLDGLLERYAIQAQSTGLVIRLRLELQPMR